MNECEEWTKKCKPKYFPKVNSTPLNEHTEEKNEASFTSAKRTEFPDDTSVHDNTPGKGDETDPFIIDDNGKLPAAS